MCTLFVYEPNLFQDARIPFGLLVKSNVTSEKEKKMWVSYSSADFHNPPQQMGQPSHGRAHLGKDPVRLRSKGRTNWWGAGNIYHLMGYLTKFGIFWGAVITRSCRKGDHDLPTKTWLPFNNGGRSWNITPAASTAYPWSSTFQLCQVNSMAYHPISPNIQSFFNPPTKCPAFSSFQVCYSSPSISCHVQAIFQ